jgi:threonine dehydratase
MSLRLTPADVERARTVIAPHLPPTPLRPSLAVPGAHLKLECWQPTGSFKVRGALANLATLTADERARGIVTASAGNHALGVAWASRVLGGTLHAVVYVPETAPATKVAKLRPFPVEVRVAGRTYDDAAAAARAHAAGTGATYVHAFEDTRTAAGQGTAALEILEQMPDVDVVVVPVGGGGLISGMATALKAARPGVRVIAVQPEASPALSESLRLGRAVTEYDARATLADGLSGGIGEIAFEHRGLIDDVVNVSEAEIEDAIVALLGDDQVVAEGSAATAAAAVRSGRVRVDGRRVALVITGGNLDLRVIGRLLAARE